MADYISRADIMKKLTAADAQKAVREMDGSEAYNWFLELVGFAPAADVEPVRHGRWGKHHFKNADNCYNCSECGNEAAHPIYKWVDFKIYPRCPYCGAYMYEGSKSNDD